MAPPERFRFTAGKPGLWGAVDFSDLHHATSWRSEAVAAWGAPDSAEPACLGSFSPAKNPQPDFPLSDRAHNLIASDIELHNRAQLSASLGGNFPPGMQDADLVLAAYAKWGEKCPEFLLGNFAFAIWDDRLKQLFCCRDHMGARPFLYWRQGQRLLVASDSRAILSVPGVSRRLNARTLHAVNGIQVFLSHHEETLYEGIFSLPPATCLTATRSGLKQRKYWELEVRRGLVPKRPEQVFEALRELLFEAVECRLDRKQTVAATLSGGLDSSAITGITARCLEKTNRSLLALAVVSPDDRRAQYPDEREYIEQFRSWPNVDIEYVTSPNGGPFDEINNPDYFEATPFRISRTFLSEDIHRVTLGRGCDLLLGGELGEYGPSSMGERYYAELAVKLRWTTLTRELRLRKGGSPPLRVLGSQLLDIFRPERKRAPTAYFAVDFDRALGKRNYLNYRWPNQRGCQAALIDSWLRRHAIPASRTLSGRQPSDTPFRDKRVVEFCLAAPPDTKVHDGYSRYLIRRALDGILPPKIQWRTDKMPFSPDYYYRYNAQLEIAREFVAAIGRRDPVRSVIDVDELSRQLVEVDGAGYHADALGRVPATIYTICFLRQFSEFRP